MFEAAVAMLMLGYLLLLVLPGIAWQFTAGALLTCIGLVGGGAAGFVYHLALRKALVRLGVETRGWLWSPVSRHHALDQRGRREVLPYFRIGAAGFVLCLAGMGMIAAAAVRATLAR